MVNASSTMENYHILQGILEELMVEWAEEVAGIHGEVEEVKTLIGQIHLSLGLAIGADGWKHRHIAKEFIDLFLTNHENDGPGTFKLKEIQTFLEKNSD